MASDEHRNEPREEPRPEPRGGPRPDPTHVPLALEEDERPLSLPKGLTRHRGFTRQGLYDAVVCANAAGQRVDGLTVRALAVALAPCQETVDFAEYGAIADREQFWSAAAHAVSANGQDLHTPPMLEALMDVLEAAPDRPCAYVSSFAGSGWVDLIATDDAIKAQLATLGLQPVVASGRWRVDIVLGMGGLLSHEVDVQLEADHAGSLTDPGDLSEVLGWAHVARFLADQGEVVIPWVQGGYGPAHALERHLLGPTPSPTDFLLGIGLRDGWLLELEALRRSTGLGPYLFLAETDLLELYMDAGWQFLSAPNSWYVLAPPGHIGPPPSVPELREASSS